MLNCQLQMFINTIRDILYSIALMTLFVADIDAMLNRYSA